MPKWTKEQEEAIKKSGTNIIVSAGAGSGKTEVLSERVIEKLKTGIHIDELLILTFTKAAAEEMKDRIRSKIKKDASLKEELIRIESAYITTFDSFALSIVKKYNYLMNIKKDIDITDTSILEIASDKILDELFTYHYEIEDEPFLKLIDKYSVKNDKDLRVNIKSLIKEIDKKLNTYEYIDYLKDYLYSDDNINEIIDKFISLIESKKQLVLSLLDEMKYYFDDGYMSKVEGTVLKVTNTSFEDFMCLSDISLPAVPANTDDEAKAKKEELNEAFKDLFAMQKYGNKDALKKDILSTKDDTCEICAILKEYYQKLDDYKKKNEMYSFQDIASLAIKIFKTNETARLEIRDSIKEIMIDEYQDTNDIQEQFISLIANNNVYMVGDVKQSIYQFRGSNPSIFKDKYYRYMENKDGEKIDLVKNFRSRYEVLNNINDIFSLLMDKELGGADYRESHAMEFGNKSYDANKDKLNYDFEVLEYEKEKDSEFSKSEIEIFTVARKIQDMINSKMQVYDKRMDALRPFAYSDAVIILDRSTFFDDYKRIFEYLNIPLTILKDGKLNSSTDIELIKNIIDLIIHIKEEKFDTKFKYNFLSVGRSFLYEYDDNYLFGIISNSKYAETALFQDFNKLDDYNSYTPYELFTYILDVTDFYNKIYKIGDFENINVRLSALGDVARNYSSKGFTIEDFLNYLDEIIKSDLKIEYKGWNSSSDSVKIMTIHKSKGLEFPVCFYADLDHKFNDNDLKTKFIADASYGLITPLEDDKDNFVRLLYKNDYHLNEVSEKIRLFYVAITRAREKFFIVLPGKDVKESFKNNDGIIEIEMRKRVNKLSDFVYLIKPHMEKYFKTVDINCLNLSKNYLYNNKANIYKGKALEKIEVKEISIDNEIIEEKHYSKESLELIDKDTINNMNFGTKVHETLEYIDFKNYDESDVEDPLIRKHMSQFIAFLGDIKDANIYKEYEFYYDENGINRHGIIDLIVEYDDHIDIIDYKLSNIKDSKYQEQLLGYKNYISNISDKSVSTYLYSILKNTLEEI